MIQFQYLRMKIRNVTDAIKWHLKRIVRKVLYFIKISLNPIIEINGVKLVLDKKWSFNVKDHMIRKDYETGEINIIKNNLSKDDKVLEIGTGLGFLAVYCSKIIGQNNVTSIEANPYLEKYHKRIFELNNTFPTIIYNSVGQNEEESVFYIDEKNFWSSSLIPFKAKKLKKINVKSIDINKLINEISPTFLIIDVEGFEYELIKLIADFGSIVKIQIETHSRIIGKEKVDEIVPILARHFFVLDNHFSKDNQYFFKKYHKVE